MSDRERGASFRPTVVRTVRVQSFLTHFSLFSHKHGGIGIQQLSWVVPEEFSHTRSPREELLLSL